MADTKSMIVSGLTFVYPKLSAPDTFGKFANGKYKTKFTFNDKTKEEGFKAWCKKTAAALTPATKKHTMPWVLDGETGESVFSASTNDKPFIGDSKNNKLPPSVLIGGGTKGNLSLNHGMYENRLCLYINAVQVVTLVEYQRKASEDRDSPFAAVAGGFEYEGSDDSEGDTTEGSAEGADTSGDEEDALAF